MTMFVATLFLLVACTVALPTQLQHAVAPGPLPITQDRPQIEERPKNTQLKPETKPLPRPPKGTEEAVALGPAPIGNRAKSADQAVALGPLPIAQDKPQIEERPQNTNLKPETKPLPRPPKGTEEAVALGPLPINQQKPQIEERPRN